MKNTYKIILGSAFAIAIIGGAYVNRPRIEVTAEATANATSTVIVPTSTRIIVPVTTSTTSTVSRETPQTVIIYQTYQTNTTGSMIDVVPVEKPELKPEITYVPTPVYTTVYTPPVSQPVSQPFVEPTPIASAPVVPVVEPVEPTFTEWPRAWVEARNSGDWLFFEGKWDTGEVGIVKCNGIKYLQDVRSGLPSSIETAVRFGFEPGTYVSCDFTVGDLGGTTLNYVTK